MIERYFHRHDARRRIRDNILGNGLEHFASYLTTRGHTPKTIGLYVRAAAHFGRWVEQKKIDPGSISEETVSRFLCRHLPGCHCIPPAIRRVSDCRAALGLLVAAYREGSFIPTRPLPEPTVMDQELGQFEVYLRSTCGLANETVLSRLRYARQFLLAKYGKRLPKFTDLRPSDIVGFVSDCARSRKRGSSKVLTSSLRTYLKFLSLQGLCRQELVHAVPTIPTWSQAAVPNTLSDEQLSRFFSAFDPSTPTGCRDYAMCLCLSELGLRAGEVAALRLEDFDWKEGTVGVASSKTHRSRLLPLPRKLGQAVVEYLRSGRPKSADRHLFLRHALPKGKAIGSRTVQAVVERARLRAALVPRFGPHVFRHTVASRMHQRGVTFKKIADVLGHQQIDTVSIYAKIDLGQLSKVALPWPEVES